MAGEEPRSRITDTPSGSRRPCRDARKGCCVRGAVGSCSTWPLSGKRACFEGGHISSGKELHSLVEAFVVGESDLKSSYLSYDEC